MITIYTQKDLRKESEDKSIEDVMSVDYRRSIRPIQESDLVVYVYEDKFKVLKNRLPSPKQNKILPIRDLPLLLGAIMYS